MPSFHAAQGDGVSNCIDMLDQLETCDSQKSKNLGDDILEDLDSYLEDINDRLTISRMVSDSIIKGMVNAVSQEAAQIIFVKELEVAKLKEALSSQLGNSEHDASITLRKHEEPQVHGRKFLGSLNLAVKRQLERLEECIANTKGSKHTDVISLPIGENLDESLVRKTDLNETFSCLKSMLKDMCQQVDLNSYSPDSFVEEWTVEMDMRKEVEAMVFLTFVQGLQWEYENQLWDVNHVLALIDRLNDIPSICHELDSIQKYFAGVEVGNLSPQGSVETDHFHHKVLNNHGVPSTQLWDENGKCEESKVSMPENLGTSPLKHMSTEELYQHFKTVITEMKRGHESTVQQMTEECFTLKRELLKERKLVKALKKDEDFEVLEKKISEVIAKLDDIVKDNEKLSQFCCHSRDKLDSLLSENCHLKSLLTVQKQEVHHLCAEDATEKLLQHAWAEVGDMECIQDKYISASISEEVYKCVIREMAALIESRCEDLDLNSIVVQDIFRIIHEEAFHYSLIELKDKCLKKDESLGFLQRKVSEIENELTMKVEDNEKLKYEVLVLEKSIKENDKKMRELIDLHEKAKKQYGEENNKLMCERENQETLVDFYTKEVNKLNKELELSEVKLRKCDEDRTKLISDLELKQKYIVSLKVKDSEHFEHMKILCHVIHGMSKSFDDFELRIKESIGWHNMRMENSTFQLQSLIPKLNVLRRTSSLYIQRLETKLSDLQKAEAEVDLLGDEVDVLLSLLEKIYVALDHYSPILQHYPGIMEILKLVRRELSGKANKAI